jgi:spore germination protein GerM
MIPRALFITIAIMLVLVIALGFYFRRMQRQAYELEPAATEALPVTPPAAGPTESVTLYVADDAAGELRPQSAKIPLPSGRQQRAEELLRALLRIYQQPGAAHPLAAPSDIRSVYLVDPGVAVVDLNAAFADQHRSGIMVEQLTVNSLVETLAANVPGINQVSILVEGKPRDTLAGHADLTEFFNVPTFGQAVNGQ